jgi:hypothetical protein
MKMKVTHEVEVQPFTTPNFVITVMPPGARQEGIKEAPKIPLADMEAATLSLLCDQFREEIFSKAGKKDPRLG